MANISLAHPIDSMKLETIQDELSITLEQIHALILVSLDETFLKNEKRVRYSYLSVLHDLSMRALNFNQAFRCEQEELAGKNKKSNI